MRKVLMKSICAVLLVIMSSMMFVACGKENNNGKIPDPGGEFDYASILVYLTDEAASIDKEWTPTDFSGFAFSKIDNGFYVYETYIKYDGGYLVFHLAEPSRDNVLRAIYYLNTMPEIKKASPNWLDSTNDL